MPEADGSLGLVKQRPTSDNVAYTNLQLRFWVTLRCSKSEIVERLSLIAVASQTLCIES